MIDYRASASLASLCPSENQLKLIIFVSSVEVLDPRFSWLNDTTNYSQHSVSALMKALTDNEN